MEKCLLSFACLVLVSESQFSFYLLRSELMIHIRLSQYQPVHNQTAIAEEEQNLTINQKFLYFQNENVTSHDWLLRII